MTTPDLAEEIKGGLRLLTDLSARSQGVLVCFTDRNGGVSETPYDSLNLAARVGDEADRVETNRARVAAAAGFELQRLRLARQVHGSDVVDVKATDTPVVGDADVITTSEKGVTIGILTADCTPVVIAGERRVAIAHAGWRGLVAGAVEAAVAAVDRPLRAWVGPSIHSCCYEVGPEVIDAFRSAGLPVAAEDRVDPGRAAEFALRRAGIEDVVASPDCTFHDRRYFSYRRDGTTGRQGGFVALIP